jgi:hypothetical protein
MLRTDAEPVPSLPFSFAAEPLLEERLLPPRKNVQEIAASTLPERAKISSVRVCLSDIPLSSEVIGLLQQASSEFAAFVMSEAYSHISNPEVQTVGQEQILGALRDLSALRALARRTPKRASVPPCLPTSPADGCCYFPALEAVLSAKKDNLDRRSALVHMKRSRSATKKRKADSTVAEMLRQTDSLGDLADDEWTSLISSLLADSQSGTSAPVTACAVSTMPMATTSQQAK